MRSRLFVAWVVLAAWCAVGCTQAPSDATPEGTVRLFLAAMERGERDPEGMRAAYALLSRSTRRSLQERAHLAGSLGGRELQPWEMIVEGRYRQTFSPARGARGMRASIDGDSATVSVRSEDSQRSAEVPLTREQGRWRIVIDLPPARARPEPEAEPAVPVE